MQSSLTAQCHSILSVHARRDRLTGLVVGRCGIRAAGGAGKTIRTRDALARGADAIEATKCRAERIGASRTLGARTTFGRLGCTTLETSRIVHAAAR